MRWGRHIGRHIAAIDDDLRVCRAEAGNWSLIADASTATHAFEEAKGRGSWSRKWWE